MSRCAAISILCFLMGCVSLCSGWASPASLPLTCFVVHCEPTNASEGMFRALTDLVALADAHAVPLTIDFTAQWAEMILRDEEKLAVISQWLADGHEVGGHHHAYWATLERSAQWDGYTNTPSSELLPSYQDRYRGTMDDYMTLLDALPGERVTACMGQDDERDMDDWPASLRYSTTGNQLEHCVSTPERVEFPSADVWHISHGLILQAPGALIGLYEETDTDQVFCVVGHVYNYQENPRPFEVWFRYLANQDPEGARWRTVAAAIEEWPTDDT